MKNKMLLPICVLACLLVGSGSLHATDLYSATVPVADYSEGERQSALRRGLAEVLVKKTGDSRVPERPGLESILASAPSYVVEFGYTDMPQDDGESKTAVKARYARDAIDRILREQNLPIWPAGRPELLVWLVEDSGSGLSYVTPDDNPEVYRALDSAFDRRAVTYSTPLHDLQDQMLMDPQTAWQFNAEAVAEAAGRYGRDSWLVVRFYRTSGDHWRGAWLLSREGQTELQAVSGSNANVLLGRAVDAAIDSLAAPLTYIPQRREDRLPLLVLGVESYRDYTDFMALLRDLVMVQDVQVDRVAGSSLQVSLTTEGDSDLLMENLARDGRVMPQEGGAVEGVRRLEWLSQ